MDFVLSVGIKLANIVLCLTIIRTVVALDDKPTVKLNDYPWEVSLIFSEGYNRNFCGGALIRLDIILTTCRCTVFYKDDDVEYQFPLYDKLIIAGSQRYIQECKSVDDKIQQVRRARNAITHPKCRSTRKGTFKKDFAVWFTDVPFYRSKYVNPVRIISNVRDQFWDELAEMAKIKFECLAVAWTSSDNSSDRSYWEVSTEKSVVDVQLLSFAECHSLLCTLHRSYCSINVQSQMQVCMSDINGAFGCDSQLGGALLCESNIYGLLSWAPICGLTNFPVIYSAIDGGWSFLSQYLNASDFHSLSSLIFWLHVTNCALLIKTCLNT